MSVALIELKHLKKYFNTASGVLHAVDDVTMSIGEGKTMGVVGESGCGKSSLGKTVLHLLEPTSGEIWFDGREISKMNKSLFKETRTQMQMVFQDPYASLDPRKTVSQTIAEPLVIHKRCRSKEELKKKVRELMDTVGLASRMSNTYPHEMDGGRRQRVGIARALALEPRFIVCDEPVSALDVSIQAQVLNLLQDLQREKNLTYMFITHDLSVVRHISDEICVMYLGQVVEQATAQELFTHTLHPYSQALLSARPGIDLDNRKERIILKGELTSPINPPKNCRFCARCIYATEECRQTEPELTDVGNGHRVACHKVKTLTDVPALPNK